MSQTLPSVPRALKRRTRWVLLLGHPLELVGVSTLALGSMVVWLLVAGYGISFQAVRAGWGPVERVQGEISQLGQVQLWSGERAPVAVATYGNGESAPGYLPGPLQVGQSVTVLKAASGEAWIEGLSPFPLALSALARIAGLFLTPGLALTLWGLALAFRQGQLLREGEVQTVRSRKRLPLPRPLKGSSIVKWAAMGDRSFWALVHDDAEEQQAVMLGSRGLIVNTVLPRYDGDEQILNGASWGTTLGALATLILAAGQVTVLGLFLLT